MMAVVVAARTKKRVSWFDVYVFEIITNPGIWLILCIETILILKICNISQCQFCVDSRYSNFFESVRFEYLSTKSILSFIGLINSSFQVLTFSIWEALSRRLSLSVSPTLWNDRIHEMFNTICCSFVEGSPLIGIISYLTRKCGGHICDRGIVSIDASSANSPQVGH
jgi:hypothetical protein